MKKWALIVCLVPVLIVSVIFLAEYNVAIAEYSNSQNGTSDSDSEPVIETPLIKHIVEFPLVIKASFVNPNIELVSASDPAILFQDDFEDTIQELWVMEMANNPNAITISGSYAVSGSSSLRIELNKSDPIVKGSKRSALTLLNQDGPLEERTYSFATLLPDGGDEDFSLDPQGSEVIAQWNSTPDHGEGWAYPPLALHTFDGQYYISRAWDDAECTSEEQMEAKGNFARHDLGSYLEDKGRWVHWVFKIKWGYMDSQNPRIQVFKDGEQILDIIGPNTTNDVTGVIMKIGITKWDWAQGENDTSILTKRVIYYDNVSIY